VTPQGLSSAAAIALAVVLAWAAVAKLTSREDTATSFRELGLVAPEALVLVVAGLELATAVLLVAVPVVGAVVAIFLLIAFSVVLLRALRDGLVVSCACFGGTAEHEVSPLDLARNFGLLLLCQVALFAPTPAEPTLAASGLVAAVVVLGGVSLRAARRRLRPL